MKTTLKNYERRNDLCAPHQSALYYLNGYGSVVNVRGKGWFCSNDCRKFMIGVEPNERLAQPTLGPFKSAKDALKTRSEWESRRQ